MQDDLPIRIGNQWVFPGGKTLPVVSGGDGPTATDTETEEEKTVREAREANVKKGTELRGTLLETGDKLREMREKPEDQRSDGWSRELRDTAHLVYSMDAELRAIEVALRPDLGAFNMPSQGVGPAGATRTAARPEGRSVGAQVVEADAFKEWRQRNPGGSGTSPDIEVRAPVVIAGDPFLIGEGPYLDANASSGLFVPRGTPYLPTQAIDQRRLFIRDIIATGSTSLQAIPYIKELNPMVYEGGATSVAEGALKPQVTIQFSQDLAPVRKIGAWVPVTTEILEDAPTLRSYIDARLGYMLRVREEEQVLNGSGNGADIRGITQTVGVQAQAFVAGDYPAAIGQAIGKIENVDGEADGLAMNPIDFWTMVTTRHAQWLDGQAIGSGSPFGPPPVSVWGLPAVRSRSMAANTFLVGAWRTAAQLFDRMAASIRIGDQHADYFTNNKVAILIEERFALAVYRPDWFVLGAFH